MWVSAGHGIIEEDSVALVPLVLDCLDKALDIG